jgi:hypothetical protein
MMGFVFCTHPQILLGRSNQGKWGGRDVWHVWEMRGKCTGFWWESPKERDHFEDRGVDGRIGSEWILGRSAGGVEWIYLAQDWGRLRALVNAAVNLLVLAPLS